MNSKHEEVVRSRPEKKSQAKETGNNFIEFFSQSTHSSQMITASQYLTDQETISKLNCTKMDLLSILIHILRNRYKPRSQKLGDDLKISGHIVVWSRNHVSDTSDDNINKTLPAMLPSRRNKTIKLAIDTDQHCKTFAKLRSHLQQHDTFQYSPIFILTFNDKRVLFKTKCPTSLE